MFVRDGAVTPGPSRKCDIAFFLKGRPKSARQSRDSTVAARSVQSVTVPSSRVSHECRSPGLRSPPFKNARFVGVNLQEIAEILAIFSCSISFRSGQDLSIGPFRRDPREPRQIKTLRGTEKGRGVTDRGVTALKSSERLEIFRGPKMGGQIRRG